MEKPEPIIVRGPNGKRPETAAEGVARVIGSAKDPDKRRLEYVKKLMCQGEVSKAFRAITSDAKVLPHSPDGLEFLQSKHPAAKWSAGNDFELEEGEPLLISRDSVASLIRSSSKGTSPGVDNFPIDILKQLAKTAVKKEFPVDTRLF
jgi:hypothetical protein